MQTFSQFFASRITHQKICKNLQMCLLLAKTTLIFFKIFLWLVKLKKEKNENGKSRHYSFKMADNDLKIWQNHLLPNPFHMIDAKFDLVLRPISHWNPAGYALCESKLNALRQACLAIKHFSTNWVIKWILLPHASKIGI